MGLGHAAVAAATIPALTPNTAAAAAVATTPAPTPNTAAAALLCTCLMAERCFAASTGATQAHNHNPLIVCPQQLQRPDENIESLQGAGKGGHGQ